MDENATPPHLPGFTLGERLGAGSSGSVWRAVRERDHLEVAVKVVAGDRPDEVRDGFGMDLVDEHLVRVHELVPLTHGQTAVVMDLMPGGSLRAVVAARGRLSPGECVTVVAPLAGLLGRLHRRGIVHGDISPDNVLFDLRGRPHLTDLGSAHALGDAPRDVHGTDGFVAPEVLLGDDPGAAADVFGLGALGWFCLVGAEPDLAQVRGTLAAELARGLEDQATPAALVQALDGALSGEPGARPDADALAVTVFDSSEPEALQITKGADVTSGLTRRLRSAVKGAPTTAEGQAGRSERTARRRRRRNRPRGRMSKIVGVGLALAFLSLLGVGLGLVLRGSASASAPQATRASQTSQATQTSQAAQSTPGAQATQDVDAGAPVDHESAAAPAVPDGSVGSAGRAGSVEPPPPALTVRTPSPDQLTAVVQALSALRTAAWSDTESSAWSEVSVPGSPAAAADDTDRSALRLAGERARGLALTVRSATRADSAPDGAATPPATTLQVRATIDVSAHTMVSSAGSRSVPESRSEAPVLLDLRWHEGAWRVWAVTA